MAKQRKPEIPLTVSSKDGEVFVTLHYCGSWRRLPAYEKEQLRSEAQRLANATGKVIAIADAKTAVWFYPN